MTDVVELINDSTWNDYLLEDILIDYSDIHIHTLTPRELRKDFVCCDFIGIEYLGQWDENIIGNISVAENTSLTKTTLEKIKKNNNIELKGGGTREYNTLWLDVCIELIDGLCIHIICKSIKTE